MLRLGSKRTKALKGVAAISEIANTETVVHTAHGLVLAVLPLNLLLFDQICSSAQTPFKESYRFPPCNYGVIPWESVV